MINKNIAVIGAGPAGIIAAGTAGSRGKDVTLFEKNEKIGKKLFITGKGRCNITNASPIEDFFNNIMNNKEFMYSGFYTFNNENIIDLLKDYGVETKVERGNRVFPKSNRSSDVINGFNRYLKDNKVNIKLKTEVYTITKEEDKFLLKTNKGNYIYDKVIIATGGKSYPKTGSTGAGYNFAKNFGHNIKPLYPSLVPIEVKEEYIKELMGLSLRNVEISAYAGKKKLYSNFGEMVITHYGISGPIVLSMSNYLLDNLEEEIKIYIDLKPALDRDILDERLLRDFKKYNNKHISNALDDLLPAKLRIPILQQSNIDLDKPVHQITKEERDRLLNNLKGLPMTFNKFRPIEEAIVTVGGVDTKEIDPSTMESKIQEKMYFVGEVIDVDGLTGGYNLQIAYSTGYLAGIHV